MSLPPVADPDFGQPPPLLHPSNIVNSPGSSAAGLAAIFSVVSGLVSNGLPTTPVGWIGVAIAILTGLGAMLSPATLR